MILTDDFVFIHQPKTGGTFVTESLSRLYEPVTKRGMVKHWLGRGRRVGKKQMRIILKHGTCREIPVGYRRKPILATIRNPYDRFVSQYEFAWWRTHPEELGDVKILRQRYPHYPGLTFEDFIDLHNSLLMQLKNNRFSPEESLGRQTEQFVDYFSRIPIESSPPSTLTTSPRGNTGQTCFPSGSSTRSG